MATIFIIGVAALLVHAGTEGAGESSTAAAKIDSRAGTTDALLPVEGPDERR